MDASKLTGSYVRYYVGERSKILTSIKVLEYFGGRSGGQIFLVMVLGYPKVRPHRSDKGTSVVWYHPTYYVGGPIMVVNTEYHSPRAAQFGG